MAVGTNPVVPVRVACYSAFATACSYPCETRRIGVGPPRKVSLLCERLRSMVKQPHDAALPVYLWGHRYVAQELSSVRPIPVKPANSSPICARTRRFLIDSGWNSTGP